MFCVLQVRLLKYCQSDANRFTSNMLQIFSPQHASYALLILNDSCSGIDVVVTGDKGLDKSLELMQCIQNEIKLLVNEKYPGLFAVQEAEDQLFLCPECVTNHYFLPCEGPPPRAFQSKDVQIATRFLDCPNHHRPTTHHIVLGSPLLPTQVTPDIVKSIVTRKSIRILSLDGGGSRGLLSIRILHQIQDRCGKPISLFGIW